MTAPIGSMKDNTLKLLLNIISAVFTNSPAFTVIRERQSIQRGGQVFNEGCLLKQPVLSTVYGMEYVAAWAADPACLAVNKSSRAQTFGWIAIRCSQNRMAP